MKQGVGGKEKFIYQINKNRSIKLLNLKNTLKTAKIIMRKT